MIFDFFYRIGALGRARAQGPPSYLAQLSHCAYTITFRKPYIFTDLPHVPPGWIKIAGQCTPQNEDGWLRFDYDSSGFNSD